VDGGTILLTTSRSRSRPSETGRILGCHVRGSNRRRRCDLLVFSSGGSGATIGPLLSAATVALRGKWHGLVQ
jgi:hypothetical protein